MYYPITSITLFYFKRSVIPYTIWTQFSKDKKIVRHTIYKWKVTDICKHMSISPMSFYRFWNRYQKDGIDVLKNRYKRTQIQFIQQRKR